MIDILATPALGKKDSVQFGWLFLLRNDDLQDLPCLNIFCGYTLRTLKDLLIRLLVFLLIRFVPGILLSDFC